RQTAGAPGSGASGRGPCSPQTSWCRRARRSASAVSTSPSRAPVPARCVLQGYCHQSRLPQPGRRPDRSPSGQRDGADVTWLLPSAVITGIFYGGLGVFSRFYFLDTIISDSKTYGTIGAIFGIMTWLIAIGAALILGAVGGVVWEERTSNRTPDTDG